MNALVTPVAAATSAATSTLARPAAPLTIGDANGERFLSCRLAQVHRVGDVPTVLTTNMTNEQRKRIERLRKARDLLISGGSIRQASRVGGLDMRRIQRIMTRYLTPADDGRIGGERVFIKNYKLQQRVIRQKPFDPSQTSCGSMTGLFRQLMEFNVDLRKALTLALRRKGKQVLLVNKLVGRELKKLLRTLCLQHGMQESDYPLFTDDGGLKPLRHWIVTDFLPMYARDWIAADDPKAGRAVTTAQPTPAVVVDYEPYVDWQLDEVKVDLRTVVEIMNLRGDVDLIEIERFKVLRLIELGHGTNLAYLVVFGREPNAHDLGELLWRALNGFSAPLSDQIKLEEGAGFAVKVMPELRWRAPRRLYLDNSLAHLSQTFGVIVQLTLGADMLLGNVASPLERPEIESRFSAAARRFIHQVWGTTGTGPQDPLRKRFEHLKPEDLVHAEDFDACYFMLLANENATPNMASFGIPPLERLRRAVARDAIRAEPVSLSKRLRHTFFPSKPAKVHADDRKPYINFMRIRYSSQELQMRYDLVGKNAYVCYDPDDLRVVILYGERGEELCRAYGEGRWGIIPHDLRMRNMSLRNIDKRARERMPQDGPLEFLFARLQADAPSKPSAALQYAHCLAVLGRHIKGEAVDATLLANLLSQGGSALDVGQLCTPAIGDAQDDGKPARATRKAPRAKAAPPPAAEVEQGANDLPLRTTPRNAVRLGR